MTIRSRLILALCIGALCLAAGCGTAPATLELISAARGGLASARVAQQQQHEAAMAQLQAQSSALDGAFDADARLAGGLAESPGRPGALTVEWVISARKGYSAAKDLLAGQMLAAQARHAVQLDNLAAADEALDMAAALTVSQMELGDRLRQQLLSAYRRLAGQAPAANR